MSYTIKAVITRTSLEATKVKGTKSVCLWLTLIPEEKDNGFLPDGIKEKQYAHLWLTDKTIERTSKTLRELGWQGTDIEELHYSNPLENTPCSITGEFEEYNDSERFKINWVNSRNRQAQDLGDSAKEFKSFNKFFADGAVKSAPATQPQETQQSGGNDEQLPF